jgi:anti-anti-sigma factor
MTVSELATFTAEARGDARVVRVGGELDVSNVGQLAAALDAQHGAGDVLVVDLAEVTYLDSSAVETLIVRARAGAPMRLVCPPDSIVRRSLEILGIGHVMPMADSLDAALAG